MPPTSPHSVSASFIASQRANIKTVFTDASFLFYFLGVFSLGACKGCHPVFQNTGKVKIMGIASLLNLEYVQDRLITAIVLGL